MRGAIANANVKGAVAALLFLIGAVGGALGGGGLGVWIGRRAAQNTVPPVVKIDSNLVNKNTNSEKIIAPTTAQQTVPATNNPLPSKPSPRDGVVGKPHSNLCIEVRDSGGRLVSGALISLRSLPALGVSANPNLGERKEIGELGVYSTSLPYPDEVIAGQYTPLNRAAASAQNLGASTDPRTDESGRACLPLPGPGSFVITAIKDDRSASVELSLPASPESPADKPLPLSIILRLGEPLDALCRLAAPPPLPATEDATDAVSETLGPDVAGRIVDSRGFGLAAVRIEAQIGAGRARSVGVSDASGNFRLTGLPRGPLSLRAQLAGYAPLQLNRRADESRGELQLVLRPGGGIAGILRDARRGNLPTGAQLSITSSADGVPVNVPLASDGSFSLSGLPAGPATLRARAPGHAPYSRTLQLTATEGPGQTSLRDLRIELEAGGSLVGQVHGPTGNAQSVTILVVTEDGSPARKTLTDERGEFRLSDLPAGRLRVTASSSQGRGETSVELRSGGEERVYLELRP
jgi:hypothetical protein